MKNPFTYSGPDVMERFFQHFEIEQKRITAILPANVPMIPLSKRQERAFRNADTCFCCDSIFENNKDKCRHHFHVTGEYIAPVCNRCNLKLKYKSKKPGETSTTKRNFVYRQNKG